MATFPLMRIPLEFYSISYFTVPPFKQIDINMLYTIQSMIVHKYTQLPNYTHVHMHTCAHTHTHTQLQIK